MAAQLTIYGDPISGNCLKVKWTADHLGLAYEWVDVDVVAGAARTPAFKALNPAAQVPTLLLSDGRSLAQSNAILLHLGEGTRLVPDDAYWRARMYEWLFWEQYSHEPYIAVRRFHKRFLHKAEEALDPALMVRGEAALARMELALEAYPFLVDSQFSLADIALVAYTRLAHEGGFELAPYPGVLRWIGRVEAELGLEPVTA